jgi:hypothetical protein
MAHDRTDQLHAAQAQDQVGAGARMRADPLVLDGIERTGLEQDAVGH